MSSMAFALFGQARLLLDPALAGEHSRRRRLHFMLRTDQSLGPASTPASQPTPGAPLPRTLASPRTGLTPAGSRELADRLHHNNLPVIMTPNRLDAPNISSYDTPYTQ